MDGSGDIGSDLDLQSFDPVVGSQDRADHEQKAASQRDHSIGIAGDVADQQSDTGHGGKGSQNSEDEFHNKFPPNN